QGLPLRAKRAKEGGAGEFVVGDVLAPQGPGKAVAQDHVGRTAPKEPAEANKRPIVPDLAQGIGRQDRIAADVVNLVLAYRARCPQDHVGGGASGRRRVRYGDFKEAMEPIGAKILPDDLAPIVDAP